MSCCIEDHECDECCLRVWLGTLLCNMAMDTTSTIAVPESACRHIRAAVD